MDVAAAFTPRRACGVTAARRRPLSRLALVAAAALASDLGCTALSTLSFVPYTPPARPAAAVALHATATATEAPAAEAKAAPAAKPKPKPAAKKVVEKAPASKVPVAEQLTTGIFAPLVLVGYYIFGEPFVAKVRGKGIGLHSQVITAFCNRFMIQSKQRQGFIKTAKKSGHDLGFLVPGGWWGNGLFGEQAMEWYKASGIDTWDVSKW